MVTVIMAIKIPLIIVINIAVEWGRNPKMVTLFLPILRPTQSPTKAINPLIMITVNTKIRLYMSFWTPFSRPYSRYLVSWLTG